MYILALHLQHSLQIHMGNLPRPLLQHFIGRPVMVTRDVTECILGVMFQSVLPPATSTIRTCKVILIEHTYIHLQPLSTIRKPMSTSLEQVSQRAARCNINLNDHILHDDSMTEPLTGANAIVQRGTFSAESKSVAIKTIRFVPLKEEVAVKVIVARIVVVLQLIVAVQRIVQKTLAWSKLHHENVLPLIGIVTTFDYAVSFISPWMDKGNAHDYVQNHANDPRPLVSDDIRSARYIQMASCAASGHSKWFELPPQP